MAGGAELIRRVKEHFRLLGAGGFGSPTAPYLAAAGVGALGSSTTTRRLDPGAPSERSRRRSGPTRG